MIQMEPMLYVASSCKDGGIYRYTLCEPEPVFHDKTLCDRPMFFEFGGQNLNVLLRRPFQQNKDSGLQVFRIDPNRLIPDQGNIISTQGEVACHLCYWKGRVYAANYLSGSIFCSSGALRLHHGNGTDPQRQEGPHPHFVAPALDGSVLFCTDLGLDQIILYDEQLNEVERASIPQGHGPRHLAFLDDLVFCVNELKCTVSVFRYADHRLRYIETVAALQDAQRRNSTSAAIRIAGDLIYVSNRGNDSISVLEWDGKHLTLRHVYPCDGRSPRDFFIHENRLYCANEWSDSVTIFDIREDKLINTWKALSIPHPICVSVGRSI